MTSSRHILGIICELLLIIGGINWGLIGLFDLNIVKVLFAFLPFLEKTIYTLVGLAGGYILFRLVQRER